MPATPWTRVALGLSLLCLVGCPFVIDPGPPRRTAPPRPHEPAASSVPATTSVAASGRPTGTSPSPAIAPAATSPASPLAGGTIASLVLPTRVTPVFPATVGVVSNNGGAIISDNGGAIISDNGSGLISERGGSVVSNGGSQLGTNPGASYHLAATTPGKLSVGLNDLVSHYRDQLSAVNQILQKVPANGLVPGTPATVTVNGKTVGMLLTAYPDHAVLAVFLDAVAPENEFAALDFTSATHGRVVFRQNAALAAAVPSALPSGLPSGLLAGSLAQGVAISASFDHDKGMYAADMVVTSNTGIANFGYREHIDLADHAAAPTGAAFGMIAGRHISLAGPVSLDSVFVAGASFLADGSAVAIEGNRLPGGAIGWETTPTDPSGASGFTFAATGAAAPTPFFMDAQGQDLSSSNAPAALQAIIPDAVKTAAVDAAAPTASTLSEPTFTFPR